MTNRPPNRMTRRAFLRRSAGLAAALPLTGPLLAACHRGFQKVSANAVPLARPDHPVTWPIKSGNEPIASGLSPEKNVTLQLFNWDQYVAPGILKGFEHKYNCKIQVSTFYDMTEAISKLVSGSVKPDVFWPTVDKLGRLVVADMLQPLNHDYLPNLDQNVWPTLKSPFYDVGSHYSVPYAVYTTGIAWRNDLVSEDIAGMSNPYDIYWDQKYKGKIYVLNDYREALGMALLHRGITDLSTSNSKDINEAGNDLVSLLHQVNVKYSLDDYTLIPEGVAYIHQGWSGDMVASPWYGKEKPPDMQKLISYWFPTDGRGSIGSDTMAIPKVAKSPVLAHLFLNYVLDPKNALTNYTWLGYQQPLNSMTMEEVVSPKTYPWLNAPNWRDVLVTETMLKNGYQELELSPATDSLWQQAWLRFKSGG